jgi:hypothetical protein
MPTFTAIWIWTFVRSLVLIAVALPLCGLLVRWIRPSSGYLRSMQWLLLSVPFLMPELLTGYAYGQMTRLLITDLWFREFWFDLILLFRVVPVGTLLWYCAPPSPLSREAIHVRRLAFRPDESAINRCRILLWYQLQGPAKAALLAGCGLFLAVFQEFELASLLATTSWTVWLFDAQAQGLPPWDSLRYLLIPSLLTWTACGSLPLAFFGSDRNSAESTSRPRPLPGWIQGVLWTYLLTGSVLVALYPLSLIGMEAGQGVVALVHNTVHFRGLIEGILIAGGLALISAMLADVVAESLVSEFPVRGWRRIAMFGVSGGLAGPLAIGLVVLSLFQLPVLSHHRDSIFPTLCGLIIWMLPRAVLLQGIRRSLRSPIAEHTAMLLAAAGDPSRQAGARRLQWLLNARGLFAARALLFHWTYWELTLPSLLNPTGLVSAPVRLYIDAHFARNALLTAKAGIMLVAPLVLLAIVWSLIWSWYAVVPLLTATNASRIPRRH